MKQHLGKTCCLFVVLLYIYRSSVVVCSVVVLFFHTDRYRVHACLNMHVWKGCRVCVCMWVCVIAAGYHTDNISLNYYNGLVMGLTEWLRDQEKARGQCAALELTGFTICGSDGFYRSIKANGKSFI